MPCDVDYCDVATVRVAYVDVDAAIVDDDPVVCDDVVFDVDGDVYDVLAKYVFVGLPNCVLVS